MTRPADVAVVGGGMLGMTLALQLARRGHPVTLFEGAPALGGLASSQVLGGYTWDRFYHVILPGDAHLLALLEQLGLSGQVRWARSATGFYANGRMYPMTSGIDFLRFPLLALPDKVRLAMFLRRAARIADGSRLERIPVADWLRAEAGDRVFERLWLPLLRAKLGENHHRTSAAFIWAYIRRLYGARSNWRKEEVLGYVDGGYATIIARLGAALAASGVTCVSGRPVREIRQEDDHVVVTLGDGTAGEFANLVLTVPCGRIGALCPQLTPAERTRLDRVVYQGIVCPSILLEKPLGGYYLTNLADPALPFTAVIEMTALTGTGRFDGRTLAYLPRYVAQDDPLWQVDDAEVIRSFLGGLRRMFPKHPRIDPEAVQVARAREVQALATLRYTDEALPPVRTSLDRVFIANSAQIVNGTLNVNETVAIALARAESLAPLLRPATLPASCPGFLTDVAR